MRPWSLALSALLAVAAVLCAILSLRSDAGHGQEVIASVAESVSTAGTEDVTANPVDFERLQGRNPDIYGWIYFPAGGVNCPVLQNAGDDLYYLTHNSTGGKDAYGAVFSQAAYNGREFSDPITVLYGNQTGPFRSLQMAYGTEGIHSNNSRIRIYLPNEEINYSVFAAVPYSDRHLLHIHDVNYRITREELLADVLGSRTIDSYFDANADVDYEDTLLVLSTGFQGNPQKRYLILAKKD